MRASRVAPWGLVIVAFGLALAVTFVSGCEDALGAGGRRPTGDEGPGSRIDSGIVRRADAAATATSAVDAGDDGDASGNGAKDMGTVGFFDARTADDGGGSGGGDSGGGGPDSGAPGGFDARPAFPDATMGFFDAAPAFPDAAPAFPDAAPAFPDASAPGTGEVWIEIDYSSANTSRSPRFTYSQTPGWGERQWAAVNATYPEAWDRFNNMQVVNDPIGRSLEIGSGSELQLMIGLEELISYSYATVHIEGRSRATSSQVTFDVYNPWNGCGAGGATLGQQWTVQPVDLDLSTCFEIGQGVQAVRVDPTNGTIALVRLRLTLHDAVY